MIGFYILNVLIFISCWSTKKNLDLNGSWWFIHNNTYCELHYDSLDSLIEIWHGDYECVSGPELKIHSNKITTLKLYKSHYELANLELITYTKDSILFFDIDKEIELSFYRQKKIELKGLEQVNSDSLSKRIEEFYTRMDSFYLNELLKESD